MTFLDNSIRPLVENNAPKLPLHPGEPLVVQIYRPQFEECYTLIIPDGTTEELDAEETRDWFKIRGANMDVVDKSMDYAWNLCTGPKSTYTCAIRINNPKAPPSTHGVLTPKV